jgi:hypothetical protein
MKSPWSAGKYVASVRSPSPSILNTSRKIPDSPAEARAILTRGYQKRFEEKHQVTIDAALHAAVTLSARYLPDRCLSDKAIDLLDEACARPAPWTRHPLALA